MIKNGKVELNKTPSEKTGEPCNKIVEGVPLSKGEDKPEKNIEKIAKMLDSSS